jgi:hypothetical protein
VTALLGIAALCGAVCGAAVWRRWKARAWRPAPALPASVRSELRAMAAARGERAAVGRLKERYGFTELQAQVAVGLLLRADAARQRRLTSACSWRAPHQCSVCAPRSPR